MHTSCDCRTRLGGALLATFRLLLLGRLFAFLHLGVVVIISLLLVLLFLLFVVFFLVLALLLGVRLLLLGLATLLRSENIVSEPSHLALLIAASPCHPRTEPSLHPSP